MKCNIDCSSTRATELLHCVAYTYNVHINTRSQSAVKRKASLVAHVMKRLFGFFFGSEKEENRPARIKRRRNGSPYVDPDALFEHAGVQKQLQQLDAPLSKMEQDKDDDRKEKATA